MQRVSKREQAAVERLRQERMGTASLVQCEGCAETNLVSPERGVCGRHDVSPHIAEQDRYEAFDADGNL